MAVEKTYAPHIIVVWTSDTTVGAQLFPYKEDAEDKYQELVRRRVPKVVLAKVVKAHGEG